MYLTRLYLLTIIVFDIVLLTLFFALFVSLFTRFFFFSCDDSFFDTDCVVYSGEIVGGEHLGDHDDPAGRQFATLGHQQHFHAIERVATHHWL